MKQEAPRGHINQTRDCDKTSGTPTDMRREEQDRAALIDEWAAYAESLGLRRRSARRVVRFYINHIEGSFDFHDWVIQYMDPTGETAVKNILKERAS